MQLNNRINTTEISADELPEVFRELVLQNPMSMWIADKSGTLIYDNAANRELFGLDTDQEIVGKYNIFQDEELIRQGFAPQIRRIFEEGGSTEFTADYDFSHVKSISPAQPTHKMLRFFLFAIRDKAEQVRYVVVLQEDYTGKWRAERTLVEAETRCRELVESVSDWVWAVDLEGRYTYSSSAIERTLGYRSDEVIGKSAFDLIIPEDRGKSRQVFEQAVRECSEFAGLLNRNRHKDGGIRYLETSGRPIFDEQGNLIGYRGIDRDVTDRELAEEKLRESEAKLRALFCAMTEVIFVIDEDGRYLEIAPTNPELLYKPSSMLLGKTLREVFPKEQADKFLESIRCALESHRTVHVEYALPIAEKEVWFSASVSPLNEDSVVWVARDITERKQYEEALRISEQRARAVFDLALSAMVIADDEGRFVEANSAASQLFGMPANELIGRSIADFMKSDFDFEKSWKGFMEQGRQRGEVKILCPSGKTLDVEFSGTTDVLPGRHLLIWRDITSRKQAEEALQSSEARYRDLVESMTEGLARADANYVFTFVNPSFADMLGRTTEELIGHSLLEFIHEDCRDAMHEEISLRKAGKTEKYEIAWKSRNGRKVYTLISPKAIFDEKGNFAGSTAVITDITERKKAEDELRRRSEFEKIITNLATDFINLPTNEIDAGINRALQVVGEFTNSDRSYVLLYQGKPAKIANIYEWDSAGIEHKSDRIYGLIIEEFPWLEEQIESFGVIKVPRLADLPPEASHTKDVLQPLAIKSFILVPMVYRGNLLGVLGLDSVRTEKDWPEWIVTLLKVMGEVLINALERKRTENELRRRSEFEKVITHLSTDFINLPINEIDVGIDRALQAIGEFVGADRSYIFLLSEDEKTARNTYEWCAEGIRSQIQDLQNLVVEDYKLLKEGLEGTTSIAIPDVEDLPPEYSNEKKLLQAGDTKSLVGIPMLLQGRIVGFLGFDAVGEKKVWSEEAITLLRIVGEVFANILSRKQTEEVLRESEKRYRILATLSPVGIFRNDINGLCTYANERTSEITGLPLEKLLGYGWIEAVYPDDREKVKAAWQKSVEEHRPFKAEYRFLRPDGRIVWVLGQSSVQKDEAGKISGFVGSITDITDRKQVEEALQQREREVTTLLDSLPGYAFQKDINSVYITVNEKFAHAVGTTPKDIVGKTDYDLFPKDLAEKYRADDRRMMETGEPLVVGEEEMAEGDKRITVATRKAPLKDDTGKVVGLIGLALDVTELKEAQKAVQEAEAKYRSLVEESLVGVYIIQDGCLVYANPRLAEIFGYTQDEITNKKTPLDLTAPEDREQVAENVRKRIAGEIKSIHYTFKGLRKDGRTIDIEVLGSRTIYKGKPAIIGSLLDITERKRAEEAIKRSEARFRAIFDNAPALIVVYDREAVVRQCNPAFEQFTSYTRDQLIGRSMFETFAKLVPPDVKETVIARIFAGETVSNVEWEAVRADGTIAYALVNTTPLYGESGNVEAALAMGVDITIRKQAQQREQELDEHKREFYRRTIMAATEGKLVITERDEIHKTAGPSIAAWTIDSGEDLSTIRHDVNEIAQSAGMDCARAYDFILAIGEATTNAYKHAGGGTTSLHRVNGSLMFIVSDRGSGIEALTLPEVALVRGYSTAGTLGMGYKAMLAIADKVYLATGPGGTTVAIQMSVQPAEKPLAVPALPDVWAY